MENLSTGQRIARTMRRTVRIIVVAIVVFAISFLCLAYWGVYDEGVRAGTVLRISKKGMIFKTYEGQLNVETFGALKGVHPIMEAFDFSVSDKDEQVIRDLESVALSGERVNLHYVSRYVAFPWKGDTKYFIVRVERLGQ